MKGRFTEAKLSYEWEIPVEQAVEYR